METLSQNKPLEVNNNCAGHLSETRKWTMFISILGFIVIGFCIILIPVIFVSSGLHGFNGRGLFTTVPIILVTGLYFFPIYFLFKFSVNSRKAILDCDSLLLEAAFRYLKLHYRFMGVLVIIAIIVYTIAGIALAFTSLFK